jgi:hypothetical protein
MNSSTVKKIKSIINYDSSIPEHKRMLKALKRQYNSLPSNEKHALINNLKNLSSDNG